MIGPRRTPLTVLAGLRGRPCERSAVRPARRTNPLPETLRMNRVRSTTLALVLIVLTGILAARPAAAAGPEGQATWAVHIARAPTWFDPAETPGIITPFMVLVAPSLTESWTQSKDGLVYEFALRKVGPRLEVHGLGLVANHAYSAPYEDLRLKKP